MVTDQERLEIIQGFVDMMKCRSKHRLEQMSSMVDGTFDNVGRGLSEGTAMSFLSFADRMTHVYAYDLPHFIDNCFDIYKTDYKLDVDKDLNYYVKESHYSQKELATRCNVSQVSMNRYIRGTREPSATVGKKIADELGMSYDDFMKAWDLSHSKNL